MTRYDKERRRNARAADQALRLKEENARLVGEVKKIRDVLTSTMHEVRRFSGELSAHAESLSKSLSALPLQTDRIGDLSETIMNTSGLLAARLGFTDIELNPLSISSQSRLRTGIYKKFEKARYTLSQRTRSRRIAIQFVGNCYFEFEALQAFELVPFVILDNAVKYSPDDQVVKVSFTEDSREVTVQVLSIGPRLDPEDKPALFTRNGRGRNALRSAIPGDGLGLYLAKVLCEIHDVKITAQSGINIRYQLGGIDYSDFTVELTFPKHPSLTQVRR